MIVETIAVAAAFLGGVYLHEEWRQWLKTQIAALYDRVTSR